MCLFLGHVGRLSTDSQSVSEDWVTGRGSRAGRTLMGVMLMSSEPINKPSLPFPSPHLWSPLACSTILHEDKVISALLPQNTKAGWIHCLKPEFGPCFTPFGQWFCCSFCLNSSITVMILRSLIWSDMTFKNDRGGFERFGIQEEPGANKDWKIPTLVALYTSPQQSKLWQWLSGNSECMLSCAS